MKDERGAAVEKDESDDEISFDDFESNVGLDEVDERRLALRQTRRRVPDVTQNWSLK